MHRLLDACNKVTTVGADDFRPLVRHRPKPFSRCGALYKSNLSLLSVRAEIIRPYKGSINHVNRMKTTTLYRPVSQKELDLIEQSGWKRFPRRLPEQPIFYPVLNAEYARKITVEWNVPAYGTGYVTRFEVESAYLEKFPIQTVGARGCDELWVPAEELEVFNDHIVGVIEVIESYLR